jgi:2-polyprenyl-6-hydroxyphenyl methylase/3-demethylubiquinone-9 3-methyltransferase
MQNINDAEIKKFDELAHKWWDADGEFRALHDINQLRLDFILQRCNLTTGPAIDVGCGGGILTESLAKISQTNVTGIDLANKALDVAKLHAQISGIEVDYRAISAEDLSIECDNHFETLSCMEMLEHVPNVEESIDSCARLVRPGGNLFFSTINRTPKAYLYLIIGAEYVLNILPRGTHEFERFIKPSELAACLRKSRLEIVEMAGMQYDPFRRTCSLNNDLATNYIVHARKPLTKL